MDAGDNGKVQLLDEEVDEEYEPTQKEIQDYADWLGINADEDADLLWIARRGLTTPLPKPWRPCQSGQGEIFYFNPETGENTWDHPCDEQLRELYSQEKAKKERKKIDAKEQSDAASGAPVEANNSICSDVAGNSGSMIGPLGLGSDDGDVHESIEILSLGALSPDENPLTSPEVSPQESSAPFAEQPASEPPAVKSQVLPEQPTSKRPPTEEPPPPPQPPPPPGEGSSTKDLPPDAREKSQTPPPPPPITSSAARAGGALGSLGALPPLTRSSDAAGVLDVLEPPKLQSLPAPMHAPAECKVQESESSLAPAPPQAARPPLPATGVEDLFKMPLDLEASSAPPSAQVRQQEHQQGNISSSEASSASSGTSAEIASGISAGKGRVREAVAAAEEAALLRRRLTDSEAECSKLRANAGEAMRLRRQLETRVEQAAAAPAAAAPALSALSEELASEAAECRRWRAEGSSRGRDLERLRADSAAEVAAHAQVAADLRAELASARAEAARAEAYRAEAEASAEAARARAACAEEARESQVTSQQAQQNSTERSGEARGHDFLAPDAPSPPTPELVSILEAELRPGRRAPLDLPDMLSGGAALGQGGRNLASLGGDAAHPITKEAEQSSLWSQLLEDDAPPVTPGGQKASPPAAQAAHSAAASSSLDISSLSAILQRSPLGDDKWGDAAEACFSPGGADDRRRRRRGRPPGPGVAMTDEICSPLKTAVASCEEEELSALRAEVRKQAELHEEKTASYVQELHQLRMELEQERSSASARRGPSTSQGAAGHLPAAALSAFPPARAATEGSSHTEAMTSHLLPGGSYVGLLDPASSRESRAPTLKLEAGWQHLERADLGTTAPRGALPPDVQPAAGVEEPVNLGEKCRAAVSAMPAQNANAAATLTGSAEMELARLMLELKQWREDAGNSERLLHEARVALHKEQASHVVTKASMRDSQREVCGLRSLLRSREAKEEVAMAEVEQCRSELADVEAERQRMQLQLHTRETELARLRAQQTVQSQQGDAALRHQRIALAEREEIIGGRERFLDEREQLATEAEAMLRKQRSELRGELQRAELAGLRATVSELAAPLLATASPSASARGRCTAAAEQGGAAGGRGSPRSSSVPALSSAPGGANAVGSAGARSRVGGRRASRRDSSAWASSDESVVPLQITRRLDGGRLDDLDGQGASSSSTSPSGPTPEQAALADALTFSQPLTSGADAQTHPAAADVSAASLAAAAAAAKVCSADELPERMRSWRRELRREHAALEEDRRLWRCEARQVRKIGTPGSHSDLGGHGGVLSDLGVLGEVRAALDARASVLNSNINEYRNIERAHSHSSSQSGRRRSSSNAAALPGCSLSIASRPTSAGSSRSGARRRSHSTSSMPAPASSAATQRAGSWLDAGNSTAVPGRAGPHEEDLLRRWRHVLQPQTCRSIREPLVTTPRTALSSDPSGEHQLCARLAEAGGA